VFCLRRLILEVGAMAYVANVHILLPKSLFCISFRNGVALCQIEHTIFTPFGVQVDLGGNWRNSEKKEGVNDDLAEWRTIN